MQIIFSITEILLLPINFQNSISFHRSLFLNKPLNQFCKTVTFSAITWRSLEQCPLSSEPKYYGNSIYYILLGRWYQMIQIRTFHFARFQLWVNVITEGIIRYKCSISSERFSRITVDTFTVSQWYLLQRWRLNRSIHIWRQDGHSFWLYYPFLVIVGK